MGPRVDFVRLADMLKFEFCQKKQGWKKKNLDGGRGVRFTNIRGVRVVAFFAFFPPFKGYR